jgi:AcrR family transcriptional regulator
VSRVVAIAGVGRNTFYECFDDFEHALRSARSEGAKRMRVALARLTRGELWVSELARVWVATVLEEPLLALAALQTSAASTLSELGSVFASALAPEALQERGVLDASAQLGLELAAAAAEACARRLVLAAAAGSALGETPERALVAGAPDLEPADVTRALAASVRAALTRALGDNI